LQRIARLTAFVVGYFADLGLADGSIARTKDEP
jgi:hypothetical protein